MYYGVCVRTAILDCALIAYLSIKKQTFTHSHFSYPKFAKNSLNTFDLKKLFHISGYLEGSQNFGNGFARIHENSRDFGNGFP